MYKLKVEDPNKLYFTSDTHWGHFSICKYCNRPFETRGDMDKALIDNWNSKVPEDGIVVHCGDFILPHVFGTREYEKLWKKLNFKTLLLIRGNHDRIECGEYECEGKTIIVKDMAMVMASGDEIFAQHYPCLAFNGDYQVFGHIHTLSDGLCYGIDSDVNTKLRSNQYDVGVDQNNYAPISYWELYNIFLKRR